jgi:hypothetical protein
MADKLPITAVDPFDRRETHTWTPGNGTVKTFSASGTAADMQEKYDLAVVGAYNPLAGRISGVTLDKAANGRGTLSINYVRSLASLIDEENDGVQELVAVDNVRDIKTADYFKTLTPAQKVAVQERWENRLPPPETGWVALQTTLYNHMASGMETWTDTRYEFRRTFLTTSERTMKFSASNPNRVVETLPRLSDVLSKLIDALPEGEWLKAPVAVTYAGTLGWSVQETYIWAWKWSVVYGGTWTGDAIA